MKSLLMIFFLVSCVDMNTPFLTPSGSNQRSPEISVSAAKIDSQKVTVTGTNLDYITGGKIVSDSSQSTLSVLAQSTSEVELVVSSFPALNVIANQSFELILSTAYSTTTIPIVFTVDDNTVSASMLQNDSVTSNSIEEKAVTYSKLDTSGADSGDVLMYNSSTDEWEPTSASLGASSSSSSSDSSVSEEVLSTPLYYITMGNGLKYEDCAEGSGDCSMMYQSGALGVDAYDPTEEDSDGDKDLTNGKNQILQLDSSRNLTLPQALIIDGYQEDGHSEKSFLDFSYKEESSDTEHHYMFYNAGDTFYLKYRGSGDPTAGANWITMESTKATFHDELEAATLTASGSIQIKIGDDDEDVKLTIDEDGDIDTDGDVVIDGGLTANGVTYPTASSSYGQYLASNGSGGTIWLNPEFDIGDPETVNLVQAVTSTDDGITVSGGETSNPALTLNSDVYRAGGDKIDATDIASGIVSDAEFDFLNGVTGNIQNQIDTKLTADDIDINNGNIYLGGTDSSIYIEGKLQNGLFIEDSSSIGNSTTATTGMPLTIDNGGGDQLILDSNEIQSYDNAGDASPVYINSNGGDVYIGKNSTDNITNMQGTTWFYAGQDDVGGITNTWVEHPSVRINGSGDKEMQIDGNEIEVYDISGGRDNTAPGATLYINYNKGGDVRICRGSASCTVYIDGSATLTSASDIRLKNLYGGLDHGLKDVRKLKLHKFRYKKDTPLGKDQRLIYGVVAQELQELVPEAVSENEKGFLGVNDNMLRYTFFNAIKQLDEIVQEHLASFSGFASEIKDKLFGHDERIAKLEVENKVLKEYLCEKDPEASFCQ